MSQEKIRCLNCPENVTKYYPVSSPSPNGRGYAASYEAVGTRMLGTNGTFWTVAEDKRGVKRWQKTTSESKPSRSSRATRRAIPRGRSDTMFRVYLVEPSMFFPSQFDDPETPMIEIPKNMYNLLQRAPKKFERRGESLAYVFGRLVHPSVYELIGFQGNDAAMIGLIDENENVLFEDGTYGDTGAELWIHRNRNGLVDSLIIDNGFFFGEEN